MDLEELDRLIRAGDMRGAREAIVRVPVNQVPRHQMTKCAALARRAGAVKWGLRLLAPIVRPKNKVPFAATSSEIAEYAVLLQRNGSLAEAWGLLENPKLEGRPEVLLYRCYVLFNRWQYDQSLPLLRAYVASEGITDYQRHIGRVNLLAAAIHCDEVQEVEFLIEYLERELRSQKHWRLLGNVIENSCFWNLMKGNFVGAAADLVRARKLLAEDATLDSQYLLLWEKLLQLYQTGDSSPLQIFREQARIGGRFEIQRDADFHHLRVHFDPARADFLFVGTPYSFYRKRLVQEFKKWTPPAGSYLWGEGSQRYDLTQGTFNGAPVIEGGSLSAKLLQSLSADFYQPRRVAGIFADLYPDQYFDIDSSPMRVHKVISRTKEQLAKFEVPLLIKNGKFGVRLEKSDELSVNVDSDRSLKTRSDFRIDRLKHLFGQGFFTSQEAQEALGLSSSNTHRMLTEAVLSGSLLQTGKKRGRLYRFPKDRDVSK